MANHYLILIFALISNLEARPSNFPDCDPHFIRAIQDLNHIEPESDAGNDVNDYADHCRDVLGPLPSKFDCREATVIPIRTKSGKEVTFENGVFKRDNKPIIFHDLPNFADFVKIYPFGGEWQAGGRYVFNGKVVEPEEDSPVNRSLTASRFSINSRLGVKKSGPVNWVYNCRNAKSQNKTDHRHQFLAVIGFNENTGESCFFEMTEAPVDDDKLADKINIVPPGGKGRLDREGRELAKKLWKSPNDLFKNGNCLNCHARGPILVTPYLNQSRLGGDGSMDLLPASPNKFRLIDRNHNGKLVVPKLSSGASDNACTECHSLGATNGYLGMITIATRGPNPWMPNIKHSDQNGKEIDQAIQRIKDCIRDKFFVYDQPPGFRSDRDGNQLSEMEFEKFKMEIIKRCDFQDVSLPCPQPKPVDHASIKVQRSKSSKIPNWEREKWAAFPEIAELNFSFEDSYQKESGVLSRNDVAFRITLTNEIGKSCVIPSLRADKREGNILRIRIPTTLKERLNVSLQTERLYCAGGSSLSTPIAINLENTNSLAERSSGESVGEHR